MSDLPFVVFATVAVVAVGYAALGVASIFLSHRLDRVMARTPRPTIADLSGRDLPPLGRVSGTVVAGPAGLQRAPVSHDAVVASWSTLSVRLPGSGDVGPTEHVLWEHRTPEPAGLADGDASVELDLDLVLATPPETNEAIPPRAHQARTTLLYEVSKPDTHWWRGSAHLDRTGAGPALRRLIDDGHITPDDLAYTEPFTQYILAEDAIRPGVVVHVLAEPVRTDTGIRLCRPAEGHTGAWTLTDVEVDKQLRFRWADLSHPVVASLVALVCGFAAVALA